jgi:hypothetical protein
MGSDWFSNDDLFRELLTLGFGYAVDVAQEFEAAGLAVRVTPMMWRETIDDRHEFADECDLVVGTAKRLVVDVKSRNLRFTGPGDYPYPTAIVDTVSGWEAKTRKPSAVVLVAQSTGGKAVIGRSTAGYWTKERLRDHVRGISDSFYMVGREHLRPFDEFVAFLRAHTR